MCSALRSKKAFPTATFVGPLLWVLVLNVVAAAEDPASGARSASGKVTGATIDHVERFASVPAFVKLLGNAKDMQLYLGLPRPEASNGEDGSLQRKDVVARKGFKFCDVPHSVSGEQLRTLHKTLARADTFAPYAGAKFCGGFHPDFLLEWESDGKDYQAFFCFGCHEIRWLEAEDYEVWCDMTESGAKSLQAALRQLTESTAGH